jgi:hypothetical protein
MAARQAVRSDKTTCPRSFAKRRSVQCASGGGVVAYPRAHIPKDTTTIHQESRKDGMPAGGGDIQVHTDDMLIRPQTQSMYKYTTKVLQAAGAEGNYTQSSILRNMETAPTHQSVSYVNAFPRCDPSTPGRPCCRFQWTAGPQAGPISTQYHSSCRCWS